MLFVQNIGYSPKVIALLAHFGDRHQRSPPDIGHVMPVYLSQSYHKAQVGTNFPAILLAETEFSDLGLFLDQEIQLNQCFAHST